MPISKIEPLSLLRGKNINVADVVSLKHPTLGEIEEIGYDKYSEYLSCMISSSLDIADILWFDMKIWYEDIKDEWDFFVQKIINFKSGINVKILNEDGKLMFIEMDCVKVDDPYRDAMNFFFGLSGEYVLMRKSSDGISQSIICNVVPDNSGNYCMSDKSFKFTKFSYEVCCKFLRDINCIKPDYMFLKGGTKAAKKIILKEEYRKRNKKKKSFNITLDTIVSSLISKGQDPFKIWDYPIYLIYNIYYRLVKIDEYNNTMNALYSGCIDTKKNPINWEKINWSSII